MNSSSKAYLVTGANTGLGKATALGLASTGGTVILACRDKDKARTAQKEIQTKTKNTNIETIDLDLSDLISIKTTADAILSKYSKLDVLIANAGVSARTRKLSRDDFELNFAVNHLGHFYLIQLLLPLLQKSTPSRIVVVSSEMHKKSEIDFQDLQFEKNWSTVDSYCRSKHANMLYVRELSKRLAGTGITVNGLHPGSIATEIVREMPWWIRWGAMLVLKSPAQGAKTAIYLATSADVETISGKYFIKNQIATPAHSVLNNTKSQRLWEASEALIASTLSKDERNIS